MERWSDEDRMESAWWEAGGWERVWEEDMRVCMTACNL